MTDELTDKLTAEFKRSLKEILEERKGKCKNRTNPKRLSIDAGLGETAVRDILQNKSSSPKLDTVHKLAKALNVPLYRLIPSMIDQSYDELKNLREENRLLREVSDQSFANIGDLRKAAKERSNNK